MSWGEAEFLDSGVNDKRESKSLAKIADCLLMNPELSFSRAVGDGLRRAAWRIFSKQEVDVGYGHYKQTGRRCQAYKTILVSQDTTDINYQRHYATAGLGDLGGSKELGHAGLCLHTAMAINEQGVPLGLVGQKVWPPQACGRGQALDKYALEEQESYRWVEGLQWSSQYLAHIRHLIIISDRESDFYDYLLAPRSRNTDLLLRAHYLTRWVYYQGEREKLGQLTLSAASQVDMAVARAKNRPARIAHLQVSWGRITCPPPMNRKGEMVDLWLVKAQEIDPPDKEKALSWHLLTSMAVADEASALLMLDYYRRRWLIERWHLVLKQGLQIERLQFDNFERLSNAIKLSGIVAWQLLCLKQLAAQLPDLPAEEVFEPLQVEVLKKKKGTKQLSLRQAFIAMAALAGFSPTNKQPLPGEKTIWQAWAIFNAFCQGYQFAFQNKYGTG